MTTYSYNRKALLSCIIFVTAYSYDHKALLGCVMFVTAYSYSCNVDVMCVVATFRQLVAVKNMLLPAGPPRLEGSGNMHRRRGHM